MRRLLATFTGMVLSLSFTISAYAVNPGVSDSYYRTFYQSGDVEYGKIDDSYTADLIIYTDNSQQRVVKGLTRDFLKRNPDIDTIYVASGPASRILATWILDQGYVDGKKTARNPDLFISAGPEHVLQLSEKDLTHSNTLYAHNQLALMVAKGNPRGIRGIRDLGRPDLIQCHPAPDSSDIINRHGLQLLKQADLLQVISGAKQCTDCWASKDQIWFTSNHTTQTPERIEKGLADVGFAWLSDIHHAKLDNRAVEPVTLQQPPIGYHANHLSAGKNFKTASRYLNYLTSPYARLILLAHGLKDPGPATIADGSPPRAK